MVAKRLRLMGGSPVTLPSAGIDPTQFLRAQDGKKKTKPGPSSLWLLSLAWALFFPDVTMMSCALTLQRKSFHQSSVEASAVLLAQPGTVHYSDVLSLSTT